MKSTGNHYAGNQGEFDPNSEAGGADRRADDIRLERLQISIRGRPILDAKELTVSSAAITVIVGPSGTGKSIFLRTLAGLIPRNGPGIEWTGRIGHADGRLLNRVGIVFQDFALFDELSPLANVQFAIDHRPNRQSPPEQSAEQWLEELRVPKTTPTSALSGGQKQRLAIARTLAAEPNVVLYDEPTSGLDAENSRRVADLIRRTQQSHGGTSIVVGHDHETLLPIADSLLLFDSQQQCLVPVDWASRWEVPERMRLMVADQAGAKRTDETERRSFKGRFREMLSRGGDFFEETGRAIMAAARLPWDGLPRWPHAVWGLRFVGHYLRLVAGPSAWIYLLLAGVITGFTATYFTFLYLPFSLYTKPLLIEDLLAAIGFALYRVLVPVLATVLIAARCGAAVAADVSTKRYGSQVDSLSTLGVRPQAYLLSPILIAFVLGTPVLELACFQAARGVSLVTFVGTHPDMTPQFWALHFSSRLDQAGQILPVGFGWGLLKSVGSAIGMAAISYHLGMRPKQTARDVSQAITSTVLWTTLFVLLVHAVVALFEFRAPIR